jgi:hypothetical protein
MVVITQKDLIISKKPTFKIMKNILLTLYILVISFNGISQNKKEQIEVLSNRIDSFQNVIESQLVQINNLSLEKKSATAELIKTEMKLKSIEKSLLETQNQVSVLNSENNRLRAKLDSVSNSQKQNPLNFLPIGYALFEKIDGDLNRDGIEDCILVVKGTDQNQLITSEENEILDRNRRGIIVLFKINGGYEIVLKNLDCFSSENEDGGVYFAPELTIQIENGNIKIDYGHGRYGGWGYTFGFQNSDFELIEYFSSEHRGPIAERGTKINFLTKKKLVWVNTNENDRGGEEVIEETWENISIASFLKLSKIKNFDELDLSEF